MLQLLNTVLDSLKTATKKVFHKTSEFLGDKIADVVANSYDNKIVKIKSVEEIITPREKREEILNELRQALQKCNLIKYPIY